MTMSTKKYILLLFIAVFFASCTKDYLNIDNTQQLYRESYVRDISTLNDYVKGVYVRLSLYFESGEMSSVYPELTADNIRPFSSTSSPATDAAYNWVQQSIGGQNMNQLWTNSYLTIRMCNFAVEEVGKYRKENPDKADDIKGQALAVRALLYFKLVNTFAQHYTFSPDASHPGVPYITASDITRSYSRQSVAEIYDAMIADLSQALELLPAETADNRYMNRQAARALLARIYLFKEDFTNAKNVAAEVVNKVPLMTIAAGYPVDMFKLRSSSNTEALFQLYPQSLSNFLGRYFRRTPVAYMATNDLAGIFSENSKDIRTSWIKDTLITGATYRLIKKFPNAAAPEAVPAVTDVNNAYYPVILRSSEMFLTAAEAAAKTNDEAQARSYLNAIRKRADPTIADITATGQALLDSIYKERRKELAFEGLRMFDLQRWKKSVNRKDVLTGAAASLSYPNDKAISPIPDTEVRLSGISQNPNY